MRSSAPPPPSSNLLPEQPADQPADLADRFLAQVETDPESGDGLPYRLLVPPEDRASGPLPLVVFLHGAGERGDDNRAQLQNGVAEFLATDERLAAYPCFFLVPQCRLGRRWVEVDWDAPQHRMPTEPSHSMRLLLRLFDRLTGDLRIDPARVYVLGLSMGGFGAWDLLCRRPQSVAAAAIICGGGDEHQAERIAHIPQWIFHGAEDRVVSVERSQNMVSALRKALGAPRYVEYPDVAHDAWVPALHEPGLLPWLWSQQRTR